MAFLLNKTTLSLLRFNAQKSNDSLALSRRGFHAEPGPREKALLAAEASLKRFKSHIQGLRGIKVVRDILTVVLVAECCREIYHKAVDQRQCQCQCKHREEAPEEDD